MVLLKTVVKWLKERHVCVFENHFETGLYTIKLPTF